MKLQKQVDFLDENRSPIEMFFDYLKAREGSLEKLCLFLNGRTTEELYDVYNNNIGFKIK